jgi:hypothetical protein
MKFVKKGLGLFWPGEYSQAEKRDQECSRKGDLDAYIARIRFYVGQIGELVQVTRDVSDVYI